MGSYTLVHKNSFFTPDLYVEYVSLFVVLAMQFLNGLSVSETCGRNYQKL
jgi:hypothetical protein